MSILHGVLSGDFDTWFAGSVVVDPLTKGPLAVYHGTQSSFSVFAPNDQSRPGWTAFGAWFTKDSGYARQFAGPTGKVLEVFLAIRRPLKLRGDGAQGFDKLVKLYEQVTGERTAYATRETNARFRAYLKAKYDGIVLTGFTGDEGLWPYKQTFFVTLDPTQVKSAHGNSGAFDPTNPDIFKGV